MHYKVCTSWIINMEDFLLNYANLDNEITISQIKELKQAKATHRDLTVLGIPYLKRIPFENLCDEDILCGRILLVNDFSSSQFHIAPYLRPTLVKAETIIKKKEFMRRNFND